MTGSSRRSAPAGRRLGLLLPALALLGGCLTLAPRSRRPTGEARVLQGVPVRTFGAERCGAGSLSAVLAYYGDEVSIDDLDAALPKSANGGVLSLDMVLAARRRGFDARMVEGDPDLVARTVLAGRPAIVMLRVLDAPGRSRDYYHYVVVDGVDPARHLFRLQFGDGKARWAPLAGLDEAWRAAGRATILVAPGPAAGSESVAAAPAVELRQAVALEDAGRQAEAAAAYRKILAGDPRSAVAWTDLGNAESSQGHAAEAERAYRRALALDPASADAANNLAWLLLEDGRELDEAERLARRAVDAGGPDPYLALDTLGRVLLARDRCGDAGRAFERGLESAPAGTAARGWLELGLGRSLAACGDEADARAHLERARDAGSADEELRSRAETALAGLADDPRGDPPGERSVPPPPPPLHP